LEFGGETDVVGDVGRTAAAAAAEEEVMSGLGRDRMFTVLLAEDGAFMRLNDGLGLPEGGTCIAEIDDVELDAIIGELEEGTTGLLLTVGSDIGVIDLVDVVVVLACPVDVVELVAEPIEE
jgi:hypothetical protein